MAKRKVEAGMNPEKDLSALGEGAAKWAEATGMQGGKGKAEEVSTTVEQEEEGMKTPEHEKTPEIRPVKSKGKRGLEEGSPTGESPERKLAAWEDLDEDQLDIGSGEMRMEEERDENEVVATPETVRQDGQEEMMEIIERWKKETETSEEKYMKMVGELGIEAVSEIIEDFAKKLKAREGDKLQGGVWAKLAAKPGKSGWEGDKVPEGAVKASIPALGGGKGGKGVASEKLSEATPGKPSSVDGRRKKTRPLDEQKKKGVNAIL